MSGTLDPATFQARAITMLSSGNVLASSRIFIAWTPGTKQRSILLDNPRVLYKLDRTVGR